MSIQSIQVTVTEKHLDNANGVTNCVIALALRDAFKEPGVEYCVCVGMNLATQYTYFPMGGEKPNNPVLPRVAQTIASLWDRREIDAIRKMLPVTFEID